MPRLDCITILEPGSFGSDSGTVVIPTGENQFPNHINLYPAVGTAAGTGTADGVSPGTAGTAAGVGSASGVSSSGPAVVPHRYWRINITANNAAGASSIAAMIEVQMHSGTTGFGADALVGGTASADSEYSGAYPATGATDGNLLDGVSGQLWGSTDTAFPHWWKYDFGSGNDVDVFGVSIVSRETAAITILPKDFSVQYSDDNSAWTTKWSVTGATFSGYEFRHFLATTTASYTGSPHGTHAHWRMRLLFDNGGNVCAASEIEMRATPGGADQCTGGSPISDGEHSAHVDDNAFDNNNSTEYWSSLTNTGSNVAYVGYSFASPVTVAEIAWRTGTDASMTPRIWFVQYADSSSGPWTTAWASHNMTSGWSASTVRLLTDPNYV